MPLVRVHSGWDALEVLNQRMQQLLGLNFESHVAQSRLEERLPLLNLYETDAEFLATVELPGLSAEAVELTACESSLRIACQRSADPTIRDEDYRRQERWQGSWSRELNLPRRVRPDEITAQMVDGVLTVRLPKAVDRRRIEIRPAEPTGREG